jgi:hypothetical protein
MLALNMPWTWRTAEQTDSRTAGQESLRARADPSGRGPVAGGRLN